MGAVNLLAIHLSIWVIARASWPTPCILEERLPHTIAQRVSCILFFFICYVIPSFGLSVGVPACFKALLGVARFGNIRLAIDRWRVARNIIWQCKLYYISKPKTLLYVRIIMYIYNYYTVNFWINCTLERRGAPLDPMDI